MSIHFKHWYRKLTYRFPDIFIPRYVLVYNDSDNKGKLFNKYMDLIIYPQLGKNYEQGLSNLKKYVEGLYAQQQEKRRESTPTQEASKILE